MSLENLMPVNKSNFRKSSRLYIQHFVKLLEEHGYHFTENSNEKLEGIMSKPDNENVFDKFAFYDELNDNNWGLSFDDEMPAIILYSFNKISEIKSKQEDLLKTINEVNAIGRLLTFGVDGDGDLCCKYHLPINTSDDIALSILKKIVKEFKSGLEKIVISTVL